jgi:hypothetical protein
MIRLPDGQICEAEEPVQVMEPFSGLLCVGGSTVLFSFCHDAPLDEHIKRDKHHRASMCEAHARMVEANSKLMCLAKCSRTHCSN